MVAERPQSIGIEWRLTTVARVLLVVITLLVAAVVVLGTFGSLFQLTRLTVESWWLLALGLGIQIGLDVITLTSDQVDTIGFALLMASYVCLLTFCLVNLSIRGFGVIAIGIAMNTLVIGLNRGMPVITSASSEGTAIERTVKHVPEHDATLLKILDDRIVLPEPFDIVVSFGDLVMAAGISELLYFASRRRYTRRGPVTQDSAETSAPRSRSTRSRAPSTRPS